MSLADVTTDIKGRVGDDSGLEATLKFAMGDEGVVFIDGTKTPNEVSNEDAEADCTIELTMEDMLAIIGGDMDPMTAFMMGKLKVEGNMGVAMKLQTVLS